MKFRFNGLYGQKGTSDRPTKVNGNKGVMSAYMAQKRLEAEERNAATPAHRKRSAARERGFNRLSDMPVSQRPAPEAETDTEG